MYMQIKAGNTAMYVFALAVVFVFLALAALYESWSLPLAVILVVPMCLLCSLGGVLLTGKAVDIFVQIGFVVLVGLACKNAILIVEFAAVLRQEGKSSREAAVEASRLRLRPILMTSLAFILGVAPLVWATGAGAEMRRSLGIAVFSGMLGVTLVGVVAVLRLPIAQYPDVTPPTVIVTAVYPGANCNTVQDTIAAPVEAQVNGVEGMMYMSSTCTNDGAYTLIVTFKLGTNPDMAQVLVQNRVQLALPVIPAVVQRQGINVKKQSPNTLMIVNLVSPDRRYPDTYLSNYATIQIRDELGRLPGVAGVGYLGERDYSMRAWLDPNKLASLNLTATDVVNAIATQNIQVAAGQIGQQPVPRGQQFQLTINTQGRLVEPEQFAELI